MNIIKEKYYIYIFYICLIASFIGMALIAIFSNEYTHPDEQQTKAAVLYYEDHNLIPDIRQLSDEYYSGYGMTRLSELNPYYFIAGKISGLFDFSHRYRIFNVVLGIILIVISVLNIKKCPALSFAFALTPQLWYIFSYATSDAFDYFICFLCLYQVLKPDSMLGHILDATKKSPFYYYIFPGILFGTTLLAKKNYFLVSLWLGIYFLFRLIRCAKENRLILFSRLIILFMIAMTVFLLRLAADYTVYGFDKKEIVAADMEKHAFDDYSLKNEVPSAASYHLKDKGTALSDVLFHMDFHKLLGMSFCGLYGAYSIGTSNIYYILYSICFALLLLLIAKSVFLKPKDALRKVEFTTLLFLMFFSYVLVVINAWAVDFQPQGRYLFPALIVVSYALTFVSTEDDKKALRCLLSALLLLSTASFLIIGTLQIIRLA